jgi:hypothetical protein
MIWALLLAVFAGPAGSLIVQTGPTLSAAEQTDFIEKARGVALGYTANLPNFICTETIKRYGQPKQSDAWKLFDTLVLDLAFSDKGERYKLRTVNNKPTNKSLSKVGGAISTGEFGTILHWIFLPKSQTKFQWKQTADLRGRRVQVFSYHIDQKNSEFQMNWSTPFKQHHAIVGFSGEFFVDAETHRVMRIIHASERPPADSPISAVSGELDYGFAQIDGEMTLVPLHAEMVVEARGARNRNSIEFNNYRKFSTEATLKFEEQ